jgi:hypothetical protein
MAYLPLSTANLPDPAIDPAQGSSPQDYFNTVLYTGDGTSSRGITGLGFQPDLVWTKRRSTSDNHHLFDAVRVISSVPQRLFPNLTNTEDGNFGSLDSFDSDGFTIGANTATNASGESFVAWNWKANGSGVSNTDGSITSTVSANTESGFSIVSYTGTGPASAANEIQVGHGLNSAPEMVIVKNRDASLDWFVFTTVIDGTNDFLYLNLTNAKGNSGNNVPTSDVFYAGGSLNTSGNDYIAYCFHSVEGFSKFGSYTGNGSNDGPFVYTGFRPAFVIAKKSDGAENWIMLDAERSSYNIVDKQLLPNTSGSEGTISRCDFLSNGFKVRAASTAFNSGTMIYMAFAENPFKYSNAR